MLRQRRLSGRWGDRLQSRFESAGFWVPRWPDCGHFVMQQRIALVYSVSVIVTVFLLLSSDVSAWQRPV